MASKMPIFEASGIIHVFESLVLFMFLSQKLLFFLAVSLLQFDSKEPSKLYKAVSRILIAQIGPGTEISENGHFGGHWP